jgi:hypothetical protein
LVKFRAREIYLFYRFLTTTVTVLNINGVYATEGIKSEENKRGERNVERIKKWRKEEKK